MPWWQTSRRWTYAFLDLVRGEGDEESDLDVFIVILKSIGSWRKKFTAFPLILVWNTVYLFLRFFILKKISKIHPY